MRILTLFFLFLLPTFHLLASERILKADFRNRPPEMFVNGSSISGPLKDILEAAAKQIEYKIKWRVAPFSKSLEGLNNGSVDIVPRTIRNKEREVFINYLGPISIQRKDIRFLVRKGKEKTINRYEDIQNLRIGAKSKTAYFSKFDRDTSLKKFLIDSDEKLAGLLAENKVDAIIVLDQAPLEKAFEKRQFKNYDYALYRHAQSIGNYFGMSKKSSQKHIFLQLNQILLDMVANGQIDDIYKKYGITRELSDNNPNNLTEVEKSWLKDNPGPYRVHNEQDWPPFNYNENGRPMGYSIEYMDLLARKLGLQIEYISGPDWTGFLDMMRTGQLDIMLNIAQTQDRLKYLHFTKPFVSNSIVIITRKGNESIRSLVDLVGKSVSLPKGFFQQEILEKSYPDIKLHLVNGQNEALQAVTAGIVDATIGELAVQNYLIAKGLLTNLKIAAVIPGNVMSGDLRLAVRKDQKNLRDILQKGINGINQSEFLLLQKKWFGDTSQKIESKENNIKLTNEEVTWLKQNPVWKIANELDWPPFDFAEDGVPKGYTVDLVNLVLKKIDVTVKWINGYTWVELMDLFRKGEIHILPALFKTEERKKYITYTYTYAANPSVLITHADNNEIVSLSKMKGKKIASIADFSIADEIAEHYPEIKQMLVKNVKEALLAVSNKQVEAFVGSIGTSSYILDRNYIPNIKVVGDSGLLKPGDTALYMGLLKERRIQRDILQKALNAISEAELQKIEKKWLSLLQYQKDRKGKIHLTPKETDWLLENSEFKLGDDFSWLPFSFLDDSGSFGGISFSFLDSISTRLGVSFKPVYGLSKSDVMKQIKNGSLDIIPAVIYSEDQAKFLDFSKPYYKVPVVVATRQNEALLSSLEDLSGKKVGVIKDSDIQLRLSKHYSEIELLELENLKSGISALDSNEIDALVENLASIRYEIVQTNNHNIKIAAATEFTYDLRIGIRKGLPELENILNKAIDQIDEKERRQIKNTWMAPVEVKYGLDWKTILTWMIPITISISFVIAIVLIWNRRLGRVIQERESLYKELHNIEQTLNIALEASNTGIWKYDLTSGGSKNIYQSDQWYKQVGYSRDDFKKEDDVFAMLIHSDDKGSAYKAIADHEKGMTKSYETEFRLKAKDGSWKWILSKGQAVKRSADGHPTQLTGAHLDITERKKAESKLRNLQETLNIALEASNTGIWKMNPNTGEPLFFGDQWFRQLGYSRDDFTPKQDVFELLLHPDDLEIVGQALVDHYSGRTDIYQAEFRFKAKDGSWKWIQSKGQIVGKDDDGVATQMTGVHLDITERKLAEEKTRILLEETRKGNAELEIINKIGQGLTGELDLIKLINFAGDGLYEFFDPFIFFIALYDKEKGLIHFPYYILEGKRIEREPIKYGQGLTSIILKRLTPLVINSPEEFIVHGATNTGGKEESFLGVPILAGDTPIGVLSTQHTEKNHYTPEDVRVVSTLTANLGMAIEKAKLHQKTQEAKKISEDAMEVISSSIEYASYIQKAILPDDQIILSNIPNHFVIWEPRDVVGGDIYFFEELRHPNEWLILVIDCTGHGVPGAFVTMLVKVIKEQVVSEIVNSNKVVNTAEIMSYFNRRMKQLLKQHDKDSISNAGFDGGILYYNKKEQMLKFTGAETPLVLIQDGKYKRIKGDRHSVGYKKSKIDFKFKEHIIDTNQETRVYVTTDGFLDQNGGEKGFPFGRKRFQKLIEDNYTKSFSDQKKIYLNEITNYRGDEEKTDDMTMVGLRFD